MKVLWITNSPFPEVSAELKLNTPIKGWVYASAYVFLEHYREVELAVASIYEGKELRVLKKDNITHYLVPQIVRTDAENRANDKIWQTIHKMFQPDLVHIHGTEYAYSYFYTRACGSERVVVSIQGMVSVIEKYYFGGINRMNLLKSLSLRDIVRMDSVYTQKKKMRLRGDFEKMLIQNVDHVIGRTFWDYTHVLTINPNIKYHFCNETLRQPFYQREWSLDQCERYSIFVSQANYPLKGFHQLLKALSIVMKYFPETKVYVAGSNYFSGVGMRIRSYGKYINKLIKKYALSESIVFTGLLTTESILQRFLDSHLFVSPSMIENSPNSIGEAQLLGVPCIASYVGGTPDMIEHGETGLLYRFEEVEMLAANICKLFSDDILAQKISAKGQIAAAKRHDKKQNAARLFQIYSTITDQL